MRSLLLAVGLAGALAVSPAFGSAGLAAGPSGPVAPASAVPACTYADRPTSITDPGRVEDTLVDTAFTVGKGYVPPDLVAASKAGLSGSLRVRGLVVPDLRAMVAAARKAGVSIRLNSAYRSFKDQAILFAATVRQLGRAAALRRAARPGHSEHQLGVALDIANTAGTWAWLAQRASAYGFVLSYPSGKTALTCYEYEPWHVRWVGRARALVVRQSRLVYRAWLWRNVPASHPLNSARRRPRL